MRLARRVYQRGNNRGKLSFGWLMKSKSYDKNLNFSLYKVVFLNYILRKWIIYTRAGILRRDM